MSHEIPSPIDDLLGESGRAAGETPSPPAGPAAAGPAGGPPAGGPPAVGPGAAARAGGAGPSRWRARLGVRARAAPRVPPHLAGRRILLADNNAVSRRLLLELTQAWGMRATAVDGGTAALEALRRASAAGRPFE